MKGAPHTPPPYACRRPTQLGAPNAAGICFVTHVQTFHEYSVFFLLLNTLSDHSQLSPRRATSIADYPRAQYGETERNIKRSEENKNARRPFRKMLREKSQRRPSRHAPPRHNALGSLCRYLRTLMLDVVVREHDVGIDCENAFFMTKMELFINLGTQPAPAKQQEHPSRERQKENTHTVAEPSRVEPRRRVELSNITALAFASARCRVAVGTSKGFLQD